MLLQAIYHQNCQAVFVHCEHLWVNPFTLKSSSGNIVCYFHTFENNLGLKRNFTKYLKEICFLSSDQHFSFKYFPKNAFVRKYFQNCQASFGHSECKWVKVFLQTVSTIFLPTFLVLPVRPHLDIILQHSDVFLW